MLIGAGGASRGLSYTNRLLVIIYKQHRLYILVRRLYLFPIELQQQLVQEPLLMPRYIIQSANSAHDFLQVAHRLEIRSLNIQLYIAIYINIQFIQIQGDIYILSTFYRQAIFTIVNPIAKALLVRSLRRRYMAYILLVYIYRVQLRDSRPVYISPTYT